eukprot:Skav207035  [mRNA]  locus=scaffold1901:185603:194002:- [translate_table: standard]
MYRGTSRSVRSNEKVFMDCWKDTFAGSALWGAPWRKHRLLVIAVNAPKLGAHHWIAPRVPKKSYVLSLRIQCVFR